jgi:glutamine amidotransferase-like uncharacterized protein
MSAADGRARIALYGAGGSPFHHAAVFARAGHDVEFVFPSDIRDGALDAFDVFVMPGGGYRAMFGQIEPLGTDGAATIKSFVQSGGMYIGCCAGSYDAAKAGPSFLALCPAQAGMCLLEATVWNEEGEMWGLRSPGIGVMRARTLATEHPVMAGMPATFEITHYNGPLFTDAEPLACVEQPTERFTPAERFLGPSPGPTLVEQAAEANIANVVAGRLGDGRVVLFGSHPEFGFSLTMDDEQEPTRMLRNAVDWQLSERDTAQRPQVRLFTDRRPESDADGASARVAELVDRVHDRTASLRARDDSPKWLARDHAMSFFGHSPSEIWSQSLDSIDRLATDVERNAPSVDYRALTFRQPVEWELDGGYQGVEELLEQSVGLLSHALATWDIDPGAPSDNPYERMTTSPYHLVAGSYMAAVGRVTAAALLCESRM